MTEFARRMGWGAAFAYDRPADIYREHARLSTYENNGRRVFDIGHHGAISNPAYDMMEPYCWGGTPFDDGRFPTPDAKARLIPVNPAEAAPPLHARRCTSPPGRYRTSEQPTCSETHS